MMVPMIIKGIGISAISASSQFIAKSIAQMPMMVSASMTMSWKPEVIKPRIRSVSLVTRVMIRPVLRLL